MSGHIISGARPKFLNCLDLYAIRIKFVTNRVFNPRSKRRISVMEMKCIWRKSKDIFTKLVIKYFNIREKQMSINLNTLI